MILRCRQLHTGLSAVLARLTALRAIKSILPKLNYPKTAVFSLFVAWVTLTINVNAILAQHARPDWGIASLLGVLLTAIFMLVVTNLELPKRVFFRSTGFIWVFSLMPVSTFLLCHGVMQLFWIVAPFLHAS